MIWFDRRKRRISSSMSSRSLWEKSWTSFFCSTKKIVRSNTDQKNLIWFLASLTNDRWRCRIYSKKKRSNRFDASFAESEFGRKINEKRKTVILLALFLLLFCSVLFPSKYPLRQMESNKNGEMKFFFSFGEVKMRALLKFKWKSLTHSVSILFTIAWYDDDDY